MEHFQPNAGGTTVVALENGHSLKVVWSENECFAPVIGLSASFGMTANGFRGYLSKTKIATVKNQGLKRMLGLTGKVRFLDRSGLLSLLEDRIKDDAILSPAKQLLLAPPPAVDAEIVPHYSTDADSRVASTCSPASPGVSPLSAPQGSSSPSVFPASPEPLAPLVAAASQVPPISGLIVRSLIRQVESPASGAPPPLPLRPVRVALGVPSNPDEVALRRSSAPMAQEAQEAQELTLPAGDEWYRDDDYRVGKSYVLPPFDRGEKLLEQLRLFREHWTTEAVQSRAGSPALSLATFNKRESRVLLYLGFLRLIKATSEPKRLTLNACLNHRAVHAFIDWLGKGRDNSEGNMIEYLSAFVSVAKFLYRDLSVAVTGKNCDNIEIVQRLRETRNRFQTKLARTHKTEDDLRDDGKWLSWSTFEEAIAVLQAQFSELISDEEFPTKASSRVLHDLLLLRYYAACPSRSGEVRLLRYIPFEEVTHLKGRLTVSAYVERERINLLSKRDLGAWTVWLADYKTFKSRGVDEASFTEELFSDLNEALNRYLLGGYRKCLIMGDIDDNPEHSFVFANGRGSGFECSSFSKYLSGLLYRLTGSKSTSNILRSSFVVNLLQSPEGHEPGVRESAANLMHHSQHQQSKVYDRRNPSDRKRVIQSVMGKRSREDEDQRDQRSAGSVARSGKPAKNGDVRFARGDLVVVPYVDKHTRAFDFWFCKVMSDDGSEVGLMELSPVVGERGFRANLRSTWKEPSSAVFHVDAEVNRETGLYDLLSSKEDIVALLRM